MSEKYFHRVKVVDIVRKPGFWHEEVRERTHELNFYGDPPVITRDGSSVYISDGTEEHYFADVVRYSTSRVSVDHYWGPFS